MRHSSVVVARSCPSYAKVAVQHRRCCTCTRHREMFFIAGTAAVTLVKDLNTAVIVFTALFYVARLKFTVPDLKPAETVAVDRED